jgi:hypothetical protein
MEIGENPFALIVWPIGGLAFRGGPDPPILRLASVWIVIQLRKGRQEGLIYLGIQLRKSLQPPSLPRGEDFVDVTEHAIFVPA